MEDRKVQASDECLESSTRKAEAAEERHGRRCDVEITLGERRARMILAVLCAKQREESGDVLDTAYEGRGNRTRGHRTWTWTLGGRHGVEYRGFAKRVSDYRLPNGSMLGIELWGRRLSRKRALVTVRFVWEVLGKWLSADPDA